MRDLNCRLPGSRLGKAKQGSMLLRCVDPECNQQFTQRLDQEMAQCQVCGTKWKWKPSRKVVRAGRAG